MNFHLTILKKTQFKTKISIRNVISTLSQIWITFTQKPEESTTKMEPTSHKDLIRPLQKNIFTHPERLEILFKSILSDQTVSTRTTRRILEQLGSHRRAAAKMQILKAKVKRNRVEWCQRQRFWTVANGNRSSLLVLLSDKMLVKLRSGEGAYVWRLYGTRFTEKYVKGDTSDKRPLKLWGIIS